MIHSGQDIVVSWQFGQVVMLMTRVQARNAIGMMGPKMKPKSSVQKDDVAESQTDLPDTDMKSAY